MKVTLAGVVAVVCSTLLGTMPSARASEPSAENMTMIRDCLVAAGHAHAVAPSVLLILLHVEGGTLGAVSPNTNATVDIGPMQVNNIWVADVAAHWHTTPARAYLALRDSFCANVEAGAWILRKGMDDAHGSFWDGIGYYHSHNPEHKAVYLRAVLENALALQAQARRDIAAALPAMPTRPVAPHTALTRLPPAALTAAVPADAGDASAAGDGLVIRSAPRGPAPVARSLPDQPRLASAD